MLYISYIISILEVLVVTVPVLLVVAFVTIAERKTMASMQRRLGPNIVGYYGLLQAFADALKLLLKEYVSPTQANLILFFLGPIITLIFSLLGYAVVPYGPGLAISDFDLGLLYMLAVSSIATYGILLAGWSANSKYAFLGSLRSTAQLISYELILSSALLLVVLLTNSLNLTIIIESQKAVWFVLPLLPIFIIFFIGSVAETNRAPFDLAEAESELVSGFMTEHSAVIFVFFFLAEYASIVLMCVLISILFLSGYNIEFINLEIIKSIESILVDFNLMDIQMYYLKYLGLDLSYGTSLSGIPFPFDNNIAYYNNFSDNHPILVMVLHSFILGFKASIMIFIFIWVRASFPRIRFDQLMSYCWTVMLPLVFAFVLAIPCYMLILEITTNKL